MVQDLTPRSLIVLAVQDFGFAWAGSFAVFVVTTAALLTNPKE